MSHTMFPSFILQHFEFILVFTSIYFFIFTLFYLNCSTLGDTLLAKLPLLTFSIFFLVICCLMPISKFNSIIGNVLGILYTVNILYMSICLKKDNHFNLFVNKIIPGILYIFLTIGFLTKLNVF